MNGQEETLANYDTVRLNLRTLQVYIRTCVGTAASTSRGSFLASDKQTSSLREFGTASSRLQSQLPFPPNPLANQLPRQP
jgi:hypothetical protein